MACRKYPTPGLSRLQGGDVKLGRCQSWDGLAKWGLRYLSPSRQGQHWLHQPTAQCVKALAWPQVTSCTGKVCLPSIFLSSPISLIRAANAARQAIQNCNQTDVGAGEGLSGGGPTPQHDRGPSPMHVDSTSMTILGHPCPQGLQCQPSSRPPS